MKFTNRWYWIKFPKNWINSTNLRYLQAIGNARKVLGGGRTDPWTSYAAVFMGHHKPHLLAQLHAHRGLHISIIYLIYLFYNFPSVPRSLTLSLQSPSGKWSWFPTLSKGFHLLASGSLNECVVVSSFQQQDLFWNCWGCEVVERCASLNLKFYCFTTHYNLQSWIGNNRGRLYMTNTLLNLCKIVFSNMTGVF